MIDPRKNYLSFRTLAILPIILFIPSLVSFAISEPGVVWPEFTGVFFHLVILFLVSRMDAPNWAKAAGYGWIILDVLTGIMNINGVDYDIHWPVRLGGHVLAGVWIATSSACARNLAVRGVGILTGLWLGGYSFAANIAPEEIIYPAGLLIIVWFVLLATKYEISDRTGLSTGTTLTAVTTG